MGCLRRLWIVCSAVMLSLTIVGCGDDGDNKKGNNGNVECISNADCPNGVCDLSTNTCQGGANNGGNNGGTNNGGTNNGGTNNGGTNNGGSNNGGSNNGGATCGDNVVDDGETCDGDCPTTCDNSDTCMTVTLTGSAANCDAECVSEPITTCTGGDDCCPPGCTNADDSDCPPATCGNGTLDQGEECDPAISSGDDGACPASAAACDDNDLCTEDALVGDAAQCSAMCTNDQITQCIDDDDCCPSSCDSTQDNDCTPAVPVGSACTQGTDCTDTAQGPAFCLTEDSTNWPGGYCSGGCMTDTDCPSGSHCSGRACVADCSVDADCTRTGYSCYDYFGDGTTTCAPDPSTGEAPGGTCTQDSDCLGGLFGATCFDDPNFPGGYCVVGCAVDSDCPDASHCLDTGNGSICAPDCSQDADCRTDYQCYDYLDDPRETCGPVANGSGTVGEACTQLQDCSGGQTGLCIEEADWNGGYCSEAGCTADTDCPTDSHCGFKDATTGEGLCVLDCDSDADCTRTGYACWDIDDDTKTECAPSGVGGGGIGATCTGVYDCSGGTDAACIKETSGWRQGYCTEFGCTSDGDCPSGSHCGYQDDTTNEGACVLDCQQDSECRADGYLCYNGDSDASSVDECAPAGTGGGAVGDICAGAWECDGGTSGFCVLDSQGFPDGYCSLSGCLSNSDCTSGSHCAFEDANTNEPGICLDNCSMDSDCRSQYGCYDIDGADGPECLPVGFGQVGDPCRGFYDCAGRENALCATEDPGGFPDGYCLLDCSASGVAMCPTGSTCIDTGSGASFCFQECTQGAGECRDGYSCVASGTGTNICQPTP